MSHVEAFATRIKIESSDQSPFGADQGIKVASKLQKAKDQERVCPIISPLNHKKSSNQELLKGRSSDQAHFLLIKDLDPGHQRFNRRHMSDYPCLRT